MRAATKPDLGRAATIALRHYAEATYRWFREEGVDATITAARSRGGVVVVTATGWYAEDVEAILKRHGLIEAVQDDRPAHIKRTVKADHVLKASR